MRSPLPQPLRAESLLVAAQPAMMLPSPEHVFALCEMVMEDSLEKKVSDNGTESNLHL